MIFVFQEFAAEIEIVEIDQTEEIIAKCRSQGRNNVTEMKFNPRPTDHGSPCKRRSKPLNHAADNRYIRIFETV